MKISNQLLILGIMVALFASCKKYETTPAELITEQYAFDNLDKNGVYAQFIVNNIYTGLNRGFNRISSVVLDAGSDDAIASANNHTIEALSKSRITAASNPDDSWSDNYATIRKVNNFLAKQGVVPRDSATKQYWRAEVRFMRAYSYFELIKRYGGVPLLGNRVFSPDEKISVARSSFDECVNYIVSECNIIKDSLRKETAAEYPNTEFGKITRGVAMALKARVLLYAASPLNNTTNDNTQWQAAATAAKDVMDLGYFSLQGNFAATFITRNSREIILAYQRTNTTDIEVLNAPAGYGAPVLSYGYVSPTQNLVDAFPMANGLAISDAASGYNASDPYANRDPRLRFTVFHNGAMWMNRAVETFDGGFNKPGGLLTQTRTGYYMRKFLADFSTASAFSGQPHNFPIIRYAEILLNYAEAMNETGNQSIALAQLTALRARAGIPAGTMAGYSYGLKTSMSQSEMREAIRTERRIELAFEEHRFWDVRRWKIAETVFNSELKGMQITKSGTGFIYTPVVVDKMYFQPKNYLYPIPLNDVLGNSLMQQNPGY